MEIDHLQERAKILQRLRLMTLKDVCGNAQISETTYREMLDREIIRNTDIERLCRAFNVSKRWWFTSMSEIREYGKLGFPYWLEKIEVDSEDNVHP